MMKNDATKYSIYRDKQSPSAEAQIETALFAYIDAVLIVATKAPFFQVVLLFAYIDAVLIVATKAPFFRVDTHDEKDQNYQLSTTDDEK